MLKTPISPYPYYVFYANKNRLNHIGYIQIVVCKYFKFEPV